uniref:Uncharacterized protein n=1 Tax=Octopus bimaculoides TaxID=37653 RepID=A0A0L8GAH8_OCTBM
MSIFHSKRYQYSCVCAFIKKKINTAEAVQLSGGFSASILIPHSSNPASDSFDFCPEVDKVPEIC